MSLQQKLRIAENLDELREDYCRANLILWAYDFKDFTEVFLEGGKSDQMCREGREGTPTAFCGKCERTGRYYNNLNKPTGRSREKQYYGVH